MPGYVRKIRKKCLGHGKVKEFQIFAKIVFWLMFEVAKFRKLCVMHQNVQPVGT